MKKETKILTIIIVIIVIIVLIWFITKKLVEIQKESAIEFEEKWRPMCEDLGGLYLEEGTSQRNNCYINKSGFLIRTTIIENNGNPYLKGDCFIINNMEDI